MTFYNILYGVLFLAAFREVLVSLVNGNLATFGMSLSLLLLVFNDTLYTSHLVDDQHMEYSVTLKLIDLVNFLILSLSVLTLAPDENVFGVQASRITNLFSAAPLFWLLVSLYWLLALWWNHLTSTQAQPDKGWRRQGPVLTMLALLCCLAVAWLQWPFAAWSGVALSLWLVVYLVVVKPTTVGH